MPIEQDAMGTAEEARPIDDIRNPALNGRNELEVVLRLILEIRILDDDDVTAGFLKSSPERGPLSTVRWLKIDLQVVVPGPSGSKSMRRVFGQVFQELAGSVGGSIVHDNDFLLDTDGIDPTQDFLDRLAFVVDRDHD
jgi:hypothetical protein